MTLTLIKAAFIISGALIFFAFLKGGKFFRKLLISAVQGIIALYAVNVLGAFIGVRLNVNPFTLAVSAVGSTPGVIMLLMLDALFK
ncbi:MAG: pro-sigmaK processing inhibitor BofA family protein [Oscillospiraceae bacterium]|nr:pro-sigmaK processing inhibitor BofA family protein [Oscillospiraceae bacterium]